MRSEGTTLVGSPKASGPLSGAWAWSRVFLACAALAGLCGTGRSTAPPVARPIHAKLIGELRAERRYVAFIATSPDGRSILASVWSNTARPALVVWETAS